MTKTNLEEAKKEFETIKLLIRKYLYIDPVGLKQWEFSVNKWGENCPICGKPFVPNKYTDEFEKKLQKAILDLLSKRDKEWIDKTFDWIWPRWNLDFGNKDRAKKTFLDQLAADKLKIKEDI